MHPLSLEKYHPITSRCFINAPLERLNDDLLQLFLAHRLQPEIGLEGDFLWTAPRSFYADLAATLQSHGLGCTLHAPFHDLTPGGFDRRFVRLTREKLSLAFTLLPLFRPQSIVCHLGFEPYKHGHDLERWLDVSTATWSPLLPIAAEANVRVMFENTYEPDPAIHKALLERLQPFTPGFCLDTGHVLAFSHSPWQRWISEMQPWLGQVHLHDNDGSSDAHQALGTGHFDFTGFFHAVNGGSTKLLCTLEQRTEADLTASLEFLHHQDTTFLSPPSS